ncbi:hypothetical protein L6R53_07465, partial [Myxococcota bacterium]|nr:hypothetical protein [Myxococcota bacterium]
MRPGLLPWLQRGLLACSQLALLLPFVVVQDCSTRAEAAYTGLQVYRQADGLVGLGLAQGALALVLALWAWRGASPPAVRAAGLGLRSSLALVGGGISWLVPGYAFLFDSVAPRAGWVLHAGAWTTLALGYTGGALHAALRQGAGPLARPEAAAAVAVLVAPLAAGFLLLARDRQDAAAGLVGVLLGLPL